MRKVLDPLLAPHGFRSAGDYEGVSAFWTSGRQYLRLDYTAETAPKYFLVFSLGQSDGDPVGPDLSADSVALSRLLPAEVASKMTWMFDSPESLEDRLVEVWADAVLPFAEPVWKDEDELDRLIAAQTEELDAHMRDITDGRLLRYARDQFDAGRFADAVAAYDALDDELLEPSDRKRIEIARGRL